MALVLSAFAGLSIALLTLGLARPNTRALVRHRLQDIGMPALEARGQSFTERIILPLLAQLGERASSFLPSGIRRRLEADIETSGLRITVARFATWWSAVGLVLPCGVFLLAMALGGGVSGRSFVGLAMWVAGGLMLPLYWLRRRARSRTAEIERGLSDAIDLIVTNVESGVGLQAALINVAQKFSGPIAEEFTRTIHEIGLGRPNHEALDAMGRRSGSREMALLARAIGQAERNGIPIARVLRAQADELRERRRQQARERANTFPLRITLITVLFIFPSLFMLILGPVVLDVVDYFNG